MHPKKLAPFLPAQPPLKTANPSETEKAEKG